MAIQITNPRRVAVTLSCTKKGELFQVGKDLQPFLEARGWKSKKVGKQYATVIPPADSKSPFVFDIEIPTRAQVEGVAKERHTEGQEWIGKFGEWVAYYFPPGLAKTQKSSPFSGEFLDETILVPTPARFHVGIRLFWDAEVIFQNAGAQYHESLSQPIQLEITGGISEDNFQSEHSSGDPTTKQALIDARLGQDKFGSDVRKLWNYRCSVTGSATLTVLEAAHIKSWADSNDTERLNPNNGLLLTANLHKLFDAGLISFEDSGKILVSPNLPCSEQEILGVAGKMLSKKPSSETAKFLSHHRKKHFGMS